MKPFTTLILFTLMGINISSCSVLADMEKEREERERKELVQMKSYNSSLVDFFENEMKPLLKDQGQLKAEDGFDPNEPKLDLDGRFMQISWQNRVSLLLTGHIHRTNINTKKIALSDTILTSKYRKYIEKKGGIVKEETTAKTRKLVATRYSNNKDCKYGKPLFGYVKNNLDSVFLPFICLVDSGYGGRRRGIKESIKITQVNYRVVDGVIAERKISETVPYSSFGSSSSFGPSSISAPNSYPPSTSESLDDLSKNWDGLKDSILDLFK